MKLEHAKNIGKNIRQYFDILFPYFNYFSARRKVTVKNEN